MLDLPFLSYVFQVRPRKVIRLLVARPDGAGKVSGGCADKTVRASWLLAVAPGFSLESRDREIGRDKEIGR